MNNIYTYPASLDHTGALINKRITEIAHVDRSFILNFALSMFPSTKLMCYWEKNIPDRIMCNRHLLGLQKSQYLEYIWKTKGMKKSRQSRQICRSYCSRLDFTFQSENGSDMFLTFDLSSAFHLAISYHWFRWKKTLMVHNPSKIHTLIITYGMEWEMITSFWTYFVYLWWAVWSSSSDRKPAQKMHHKDIQTQIKRTILSQA